MRDPSRRGHLAAALLTIGGFVALVLWLRDSDDRASGPEGFSTSPQSAPWPTEDATWVGTDVCARCHEEERRAWGGSHHDRATEALAELASGAPFDDREIAREGFRARFSRDGEGASVRIVEGDGPARSFEARYALGARPLRQWVVDVGRGRLQALTVAWDLRPAELGGQRLFDPSRKQPEPGEPLHFLSDDQSWNGVCADCHSTGVSRGWDAERGVFETEVAEIDVGCEACHGPGSVHVAWAESGGGGTPQGLVAALSASEDWSIADGRSDAAPRPAAAAQREVEACAPCHARRDVLVEGHRPDAPLLDGYRPELLSRRLYHHDGQIDAEVYEYGSFLQSRMYHAGVRCSDCHEPHALSLRHEGDALCTGCHRASIYASASHHHHEAAGSACVDCHMVEKTYLEIDGRRDHSFRIPRPDLAAALGVPDACTGCHEDEGSAWAAERITEWFGPERRAHFGTVLHAARRRDPDAAEKLRDLAGDEDAPAIVRATALALFDDFPGPVADEALGAGARSAEPLVRLGAAYGARELEPADRIRLLAPLVGDEVRAVRLEAARTLAVVPVETLPAPQAEGLTAALEELIEVERRSGHRPDAWLRIGRIALDRGDEIAADRAWRKALDVSPRFTPAMVSLADLRRSHGDEVEAEALLRRATSVDDTDADAFHALGLLLVRTGRTADATEHFARAVALRADNARFHYVLGVALHDAGDLRGAIHALERGVDAHQNDADLLRTLAVYADEAGDHARAEELRARLRRVRPDEAP